MSLTPELAAQIRQRLKEYLANSLLDSEQSKVIAKFGALPLMLDGGGVYAIRPDGEIITYLWDAPHDLRVENNPRICRTAIFQGSLRYPELRVLVPLRPAEATECRHCQGKGIPPEAEENRLQDVLVCYCGGLGWLLPGE